MIRSLLTARYLIPTVYLLLAALNATAQPKEEDTPWLASVEQENIRRMMPKGVPMSDRLKFYKLRPVFQSLYFLNSHPQRDILPANDPNPFAVSGGMHAENVKPGTWRNITGLDLPEDAKIEVWETWIDVGAPGPVPKVFWRFPSGTIAYDVLVRINGDGSEHVFEVRTQARDDGGWRDGTRYVPNVKPNGRKWRTEWGFPVAGLSAASNIVSIDEVDHAEGFVTANSTVVYDDGGKFFPKGYRGTGMSCSSCHNQDEAGKRTGYGTATRGGDGRYSWAPFNESGGLDFRWPIVRVKR